MRDTLNPPIGNEVAQHVLNHLLSTAGDGPFDRGDVEVALKQLEIPTRDQNVDAVLAAQARGQQAPQSEEGAARMSA